jgi:outer membrane protein TolC
MPFVPAVLLGAALAAGTAQQKLTLVEAVRAALQRNPELLEARAAAAASASAGAVARAFPELTLSYIAWQQPWAHPFDPSATNMHMFGFRQALPFLGQRHLAGKAADLEAAASLSDAAARRLAVEAQIAHALTSWWRQEEELAVHLRHMELAERTVEAVQLRYATGGARQADILRAELDLHRLHADIAGIREQIRAAKALLAAAMGLPLDAALAPPEEPEVASPKGASERPELIAARLRGERAGAAQELANRARAWPEVMVGFDYMLMPDAPDAYALMIQVSAPWLWGKRKPEQERAAREADRAAAAARATANAAAFEEVDASARVDAVKAQLGVLRDTVLPLAERVLEATRSNYATGQADLVSLLDAERALLDARLSVVRQRAALGAAIADVRRARGIDLLPEVTP